MARRSVAGAGQPVRGVRSLTGSWLGELCIRGNSEVTALRGTIPCAGSERQAPADAELPERVREVALANGLRKTIHWFRNTAANSKADLDHV